MMKFSIFSWPFRIMKIPFSLINIIWKLTIISLIVLIVYIALSKEAHAACLGANHFPFPLTGGSREECLYKYNIKHAPKQEKSGTLSSEVEAWERSFSGEQQYVKRIGYDKLHSLQVAWGIYFMPHEVGYRRQFASHFTPSAIIYHYYFNPSFSVGIKYQSYKLVGSPFKDANGNNTQGSDTLDIMRWWSQGTFHFEVTEGWEFYAQMGMMMMDSSRVWLNGVAKTDGVGSDQFIAEFGLAYFVGSNKAIAGLKFNDAPNGSNELATYHNLGDTELFAGFELGLF